VVTWLNFSKIFWRQAGMFRDLGENPRAKLFVVVEAEHIGSALRMLQLNVRAFLRNNLPTNPQ